MLMDLTGTGRVKPLREVRRIPLLRGWVNKDSLPISILGCRYTSSTNETSYRCGSNLSAILAASPILYSSIARSW